MPTKKQKQKKKREQKKKPRAKQLASGKAKLRKPLKTALTKSLELKYFRQISVIGKVLQTVTKTELTPELATITKDLGSLSGVLSKIRVSVRKKNPVDARKIAKEAEKGIREKAQRDQDKVFRGILGIDPLLDQPNLRRSAKSFISANVDLIESIEEEYLEALEKKIRTSVKEGVRVETLAKDIEKNFLQGKAKGELKNASARAALIARDQVNKYNSKVTQSKQRSAGVEEYIWRTADDTRVRPSHAALDNTRQSWDKPPSVDGRSLHPGEDFQCRCRAEPVFTKEVAAVLFR